MNHVTLLLIYLIMTIISPFPFIFHVYFPSPNFPFFIFSGKYLRQKRIDFQLPYDILWLWKHDQVINHVENQVFREFFHR